MRHAVRLVVFLSLLSATALAAEEAAPAVPGPKEAWDAMQKEMAQARGARDMAKVRAIQSTRPREFLAAWEKSGRTAEGEDRYWLAQMLGLAARPLEAKDLYLACAMDPEFPRSLMGSAGYGFGRSVLSAMNTGDLEGAAADAQIAAAQGLVAEMEAADAEPGIVASLLQTIGYCHDRRGRPDRAIDLWMRTAETAPERAYGASRNIFGTLSAHTWRMEDYDALRERGRELSRRLLAIQEGYVADLTEKKDRNAERAASALERMQGLTKPLEMLGKPAPAWTLVHAFGEKTSLEEFRGKVLLVDFWATWCGWCIRSFPALRDLLRDFADTDFALVGATAPASYVTEANYGLDDDMKAKAEGAPKPATHRLPRNATPEQTAEFRKTEIQALEKFIANHEMTWPVVMVDAKDPGEKYALTGWPHAMVLDRQGRVRCFKRGALLRDRPEQVEKFRKVLRGLLAEE